MNRVPDLATVRSRVRRKLDDIRARQNSPTSISPDVFAYPDSYEVVFDAPGVNHDDAQVRYVDGSLLVRIERFRDVYEGFELREPGRMLSFDGSIDLPPDATVTADVGEAMIRANGTLLIRVPRDGHAEAEDTVHSTQLSE